MSDEIPIPDSPLNEEELSLLSRLTLRDIDAIDEVVLSCASSSWRKVAMIAGLVKKQLESQYPEFSCSFYAERIRALANRGRLESHGNLSYMRFSEVRMPNDTQPLAN
jgi:hypothetical protein